MSRVGTRMAAMGVLGAEVWEDEDEDGGVR